MMKWRWRLLFVLGVLVSCRNIAPITPTPSPAPTIVTAIPASPQPETTDSPPQDPARILFESNRTGSWDIYLMEADGSNVVNLTNNSHTESDAAWSPDGREIAYVSNRGGRWDIYVLTLATGVVRQLTDDAASDADPSWSPDGSEIAFASNRTGSFDIFVMNADGSNPRQLTTSRSIDREPSWSPDGRQIAFTTWRDGNGEIYVLNARCYALPEGCGVGEVRLTHNEADDKNPMWSPDGRKIAFESVRDDDWEIYVMDADGRNQGRLTYQRELDEDPAWSPDGTRLVFVSLRDGNREIYEMIADGSAPPRRLTFDCARDIHPLWSPGLVLPSTVLTPPQTRIISIEGERRVNLREGPGTTFAVAGDAGPGDCLTAVGRSADNAWLQVRSLDGAVRWVAAHLTNAAGDLSSVPVTEARG